MSVLSDAKILAEAVLEEWWWGDMGDYGDQKYHCNYCSGAEYTIDTKDPKSIKHDLDCPVLVALDILT